jgi:hypothetical protein
VKNAHGIRGVLKMMIDQTKRNMLKSLISDVVPEGKEQVFGIAPVAADRSGLNGCQVHQHVSSPARRALWMDIQPNFNGRVIAPLALALVCLAPVFVFAKSPSGFPDFRTVQNSIQASESVQASAQNSEAGEQQDANSQPQLRPLSPERVVSKPPQITYEDGQLTIVAENSPLSEVMSALRATIGADIDLPASVARQRIWVRLGPGPARQVLRDLLDNTELDYVFQASESDPEGIKSVLLTLRSKTVEQGVPGSRVARSANRRDLPATSSPAEAPEQDSSAPAESAAVSDTAPAVSPSPPADAQTSASKVQSVQGASEQNLSRPSAGTSSEQMIQQLQSMYQQRRQMQTPQNQKPPSNNN